MLDVIPSFFRLYKYIIHINFHRLSYLLLKHLVHQPLIRSPSVKRAEGHPNIAIEVLIRYKGCMLLIGAIHGYLVVPRLGIHEVEESMANCGVHEMINLGKGKAILGTCFIKISKIHTSPPLPVRILHEDRIVKPKRVE